MILNELYQHAQPGYQDVEDDNSRIKLGDLRKTKLTLKQITKLRQMNDIRAYEHAEKLVKVRKQYAPALETPSF
tara:strand:+ start:191 stop:412 length:222 start_codon:yes stop_codon:yes gene_type:complete